MNKFDVRQLQAELAEFQIVHQNLVSLGAAIERDRFTRMLESIFSAYDRACAMPETKIPSILTAAICAARMDIGEKDERAREAGL